LFEKKHTNGKSFEIKIKKHIYTMKMNTRKLLILLAVAPLFPACKKVIDVDLNSAAPHIVIEGTMSDQPGPYFVKLSKTVNFSDANTFPTVSGALVKITDNIGTTEILTETNPGTYSTSSALIGIVGRTYTLTVNSEGKEYSASSAISSGDYVTVALQSIDKGVYEYFRTLNQANNSGQSATPANPVSNFSNGALGYFSAYAVKVKSIFIP
jgi:hypothetical protein